MIRILWLQAVKDAWNTYIERINNQLMPSHSLTPYLKQQIDMGMTLEEFGEMVFIEGFVAGENYYKSLMLEQREHEQRLN